MQRGHISVNPVGTVRVCIALCLLFCLQAVSVLGQSIVFSELMYNPVDGTNPVDGDLYEFLEIYNAGPSSYDLTDAEFTDGIAYTFSTPQSLPSGAYLLVVKDRAAFTNRYPGVTNIAPGIYSGSLANGGERVKLEDKVGNDLFSVDYKDAAPWPDRADGHGASLVLNHPGGDPDVATNWCASDEYLGTPGVTGICAQGDIVINEVLTHTDPPLEDAVELHNLTTNAIDVSGWYLSDNVVTRKKYRITNTVIAAQSYAVIYEYQFTSSVPGNIPFALSELGESVYLTAADGSSNLTRFVDYVEFDAAENGYSFGRYPNGTGAWVTLAARSLGSSNGLPRVGPVVISEVMYHPPNDNFDEEYIELLNVASSNMPLYDTSFDTNTWKLTSAVDYQFPTGVTVAVGERILITGSTNLNAFRSIYGLDPSVQVFGPWTGKLDNAGESVRLYKPGDPETNLVPYILVDRLDYGDDPPWPTAPDGNGPSLERVVNTNFANDFANWFAGPPGGTPGSAPVGGFVNPQITPAAPIAGSAFTVTVSVVAETLPTQVVMRTSISGATNDLLMTDDGVAPDAIGGDQVFTTTVGSQPDGTWVYYLFKAFSLGGETFALPSPGVSYVASPTLTLRMSGNGLLTTVQPTESWETYETVGYPTDPKLVYIYLNAAGEALLDDVSFVDIGTSTEHTQNGDFESALGTEWKTNGNHSLSYREQALGEASNHVLHIVATAAGSSSANSVNADLDPQVTTSQLSRLTFRTRRVSVEEDQWSWIVVGTAPPDVVINEIMYHPDQTNEAPFEYVELYNPGASAVSLAGWELDGVRLDFPTGAVIGAGGYLVCAATTNQIQATYGATNVLSAWLGTLQNDSETLRLINSFGRELDRVEYDDREPWPTAADGYGPSLERIDPEWIGDTSVNWQTSMAATNWIQVVWTSQISELNQGVSLFLGYDGKCWVDDVSVTPVGSASELMTNGDFESDTDSWQFLGNHDRSRVEPNMGRSGGDALALAGSLTRWLTKIKSNPVIRQYGDSVTNCALSSSVPTTNGDDYVVSCWIRREGLGGPVLVAIDGVTNSVDLSAFGTPGNLNSIPSGAWPVGVIDVQQDYNMCPVGTQNVVRARVSSASAVTNVDLFYRSFTTNAYEFTDAHYSKLDMHDDGAAPDVFAGDGIYSVSLPAFSTNWVFVRYHVTADSTNGYRVRSPRRDDPSTDYAYWVDEVPSQQNAIPNWFVLSDVDGTTNFYPVARRCCAVSPDGQAVVDAVIRHRGNPDNDPARGGLALRVNRGNPLDTWFEKNQGGINFRHRGNNSQYWYFRVVNEYLAYYLQELIGLPTPRVRHVCLWMDGVANITMSLEDPEEAFLDDYDISQNDYVSRSGWRGRVYVGGDPLIDNFDGVKDSLEAATNSTKPEVVRTNLAMESVRYSLALFSVSANIDQYFDWNVFQHRSVEDGRWRQYPWDVDKSFFTEHTNLHPYYQTELHPSEVNTNSYNLLGTILFYPESGPESEFSLPYRTRQQSTLWRYCYTIFTTNFLFPVLDAVASNVAPAYDQIGYHAALLSNQVADVKSFIVSRRNFYMNGSWSDRDANLWASSNTYDSTQVVINEIMANPLSGGEYMELYNPGQQTIDLSWWPLSIGDERYRLPHETMLGPTSYLVIADAQPLLTNAFLELSDGDTLIHRYEPSPLWDWPIVWTTAVDYATRIVQVPQVTLPNSGAQIALYDLESNLVDSVTYSNGAPWPLTAGESLELIEPSADNSVVTNWRLSQVVGTPGWKNAATLDKDEDSMGDEWEERIVQASGGTYTTVVDIVDSDDFDNDGIPNIDEWLLGMDPTVSDSYWALVEIVTSDGFPVVWFDTIAATGSAYQAYSGRYYTLENTAQLSPLQTWNWETNYLNVAGNGQSVFYTNVSADTLNFYRFRANLTPIRP